MRAKKDRPNPLQVVGSGTHHVLVKKALLKWNWIQNLVTTLKGRLSEKDRQRETSPELVVLPHRHSAVESATHVLEVHGLDRCPNHGITGLKRYVALAVLACNIQRPRI